MNLKKALKLYDFVKPHLPKDPDKLQMREYLYTIVNSIRTNGKSGDFGVFYKLCTDKDLKKGMAITEVIKDIVEALADINLGELHRFLEGIGYE